MVEIVPSSRNSSSDPYPIPIQPTYLACGEDRSILENNGGLL